MVVQGQRSRFGAWVYAGEPPAPWQLLNHLRQVQRKRLYGLGFLESRQGSVKRRWFLQRVNGSNRELDRCGGLSIFNSACWLRGLVESFYVFGESTVQGRRYLSYIGLSWVTRGFLWLSVSEAARPMKAYSIFPCFVWVLLPLLPYVAHLGPLSNSSWYHLTQTTTVLVSFLGILKPFPPCREKGVVLSDFSGAITTVFVCELLHTCLLF